MIKNQILEKGYTIFPSVLNEQEIEDMNKGICDTLEHLTSNFDIPMKLEDKSTWKSYYKLAPSHSMIIQHWGIGHAQYVWNLRQNKKIIDVFENIWGTNDLLTSFDAVSFHLPPEITGRGWYKGNEWFHTDQSLKRNDFECVQSWVTGYDVRKGDATLRVIEGSHLLHKEFRETFQPKINGNWYQLNPIELEWFLSKGCKIVDVECEKGSMVLWDSRAIHYGVEARSYREKANFRHVVYICMMPRASSNHTNIEKKKKAFEEMRLTTHWANKQNLFPKYPRYADTETIEKVKELEKPILNEFGMKLVGY